MKQCLFLLMFVCSVSQANPQMLILGDSLSAGYGIDSDRGWVSLLQQRLDDAGYSHQVINASISGDTTAGGLSRLPQLMKKYRPQWVIIELGGNDGLRGLQLSQTRSNLLQMVQMAQSEQSHVLLLGMMLPPNFGKLFAEKFLQMYQEVAQQTTVPLVPFFLQGVADRADLMQADGIHPNALGQPMMLENVWQVLGAEMSRAEESPQLGSNSK